MDQFITLQVLKLRPPFLIINTQKIYLGALQNQSNNKSTKCEDFRLLFYTLVSYSLQLTVIYKTILI